MLEKREMVIEEEISHQDDKDRNPKEIE